MDDRAFLGQGWHFPVTADETTGCVRTVSADEDIAQAIRIILHTRRGERVMRPDFGSLLYTFAFEPLSLSVKTAMREEIRSALTAWEPRITDIEADIEDAEGCVMITVRYVVRDTNNPFNLVFPFYIEEGGYAPD